MHDPVQIQKAERTKVEKWKRHFLLRELLQQPMDTGTWLPREIGGMGTHKHRHFLRELLRQPRRCPKQGLSLTSSWHEQTAPPRPRFWAQILSNVRWCRPLPTLGPPRQESLTPGRPPLWSAQGHLWGKSGPGAGRGRRRPCWGCREPTESGATVLRAERPLLPPQLGESGLLTPEMKQA